VDKDQVLIFGIGVAGRAIYRQIKSTHNVIGFIDNNKKLDGTKYDEKVIYHPKRLSNIEFDKIVMSGVWVESMLKQLEELGIPKSKILHIPDNSIDFSSDKRVETTDDIMRNVSDVCKNLKINSYVIGSSLATLFRDKDLSCVADVDLFLTSQDDAKVFYKAISNNKDFQNYEITNVLYTQDEILANKGDIKKVIITSKVLKSEEEASIVDVSIADFFDDKYMVRHGENYIYIPKALCYGERYHNYKNMQLQIPFLAEDYLSLLYGENWIVPPKKWDQSDYGNLLTQEQMLALKNKQTSEQE
jgi:hypothetical protein